MIFKSIKIFFSGEIRSINAKINIVASIIIKGFSMLITLLLVPLTLGYLTAYEYGVWLTLSSILTWLNFFDIGLGSGLRNKLSEALSSGNFKLGQTYVSTAFFLLFAIMFSLYLLFIAINQFINWAQILNLNPNSIPNINSLILFAVGFFSLTVVVKLTGIILTADQKPAYNDFINLISNLLSLIIIFILTKTTSGSLLNVALVFSATPAIVFLFVYPIVFYSRYKFLRPSIKSIEIIHTKELLGIGIQFFIIQIAGLIIFTTTNVIISQLFGPQEVTPYNIAYRYFSILIMAFNIILTPIWSATTEAYIKKDNDWILRSMNQVLKIWGGSVFLTLIMIAVSTFVYKIWVGPKIKIPINLSILMGIYTLLLNWNFCFATFLSGIGKIRLQLINAVITGILFLPVAFLLCKWLNISGIIIAMCLTQLVNLVVAPLQFYKLTSNKAYGIWNK